MNHVFLLLGGNLGDRQQNLKTAKELVAEQCGAVTISSSVYETQAWGKTDQPSFLNQVVKIKTSLSAEELMQTILRLENLMGRKRNQKYGPRVIDIDILLFNDAVHNSAFVKIPHPELQNRRFALTPLAEIAPGLRHPVFNKSISELLEECPDQSGVKKYEQLVD